MNFDTRSALAVAFKYWRRSATVLGLAIALAIAVCLVMQTQYTATASILVKLGRELVYRPEVGSTSAALPTIDKDELIASNVAIISGPDIARTVIDRIGLNQLYPKLVRSDADRGVLDQVADLIARAMLQLGIPEESVETRALRKFCRKLSVTPVKKTDLIEVSFMHPNPVIAARVANMVIELFQQKSGSIYANPNIDAMQRTVDAEQAALKTAREKLAEFRHDNGVYSFDSQLDLLLKQRAEADSELKSSAAHAAELKSMLAALLAQRTSTPPLIQLYADTERHKVIDDTQSQLLSLTLQEQQMASRFASGYRPLVDLRNQIRVTQNALANYRGEPNSQSRRGVNDTYQELNQETMRRQAELQATLARGDVVQTQLLQISAQVATLSSRQRELQGLEQDASLRSDALKASYDKLAEARATEQLNREKPASFSVALAASPPDLADPTRPMPLLYTVAALIAGIFGGVCVTFFSHRLADVFVTPEQATRRLNMPVLAVFGYNSRIGHVSRGRAGPMLSLSEVVRRIQMVTAS